MPSSNPSLPTAPFHYPFSPWVSASISRDIYCDLAQGLGIYGSRHLLRHTLMLEKRTDVIVSRLIKDQNFQEDRQNLWDVVGPFPCFTRMNKRQREFELSSPGSVSNQASYV
ncbi:hypothetical protein DV737_g4464, partial [Chaetothyriales sp. CBS 132003]